MATQTENIALLNSVKSDIQSFITSGLKHIYHSTYLFLQIDDKTKVQQWLTDIHDDILSAKSWRAEDIPLIGPDQPKQPKLKPTEILNIAFTVDGLRALDLPDSVIQTFPVEFQQGITGGQRPLILGDTHDSAPENWYVGNPKYAPIHILLILNAGQDPDDTTEIDLFTTKQKDIISGSGLTILYEEKGHRRGDDKELFGFHDGIAQPPIQGINIYDKGNKIKNVIATGEFILGYQDEYGLFPATPVIDKKHDPNDILPDFKNPYDIHFNVPSSELKDLGLHGSYVVYRKLEQDVPAFWDFVLREVERIDGGLPSAERLIWLASKMVGRYPNGNPLVPQAKTAKGKDDFMYAADDLEGLHCPVGSHLRRSNPRDVFNPENPESSLTIVDKHRIIRRGRNYGMPAFDIEKLDNPDDTLVNILKNLNDSKPRGLHFLCVNASIQRQFEFIQHSWSNNPNLNALYENKDPIIGDNGDPDQPDSRMSIPTKGIRIRTSNLPRFVHVKGGAYLFMPSKIALRFLAQI